MDTTLAERQVWVLRVPDVLARVVRAAATHPGAPIAVLTDHSAASASTTTTSAAASTTGAAAAAADAAARAKAAVRSALAGRKRTRTGVTLTLDAGTVREAVGAEEARRTPLVYNVAPVGAVGAGVRVLSRLRGVAGLGWWGTAASVGTAAAAMDDPAYAAYDEHRRALDKAAAAGKRTTQMVTDVAAAGAKAAALASRAAVENEAVAAALAAAQSSLAARGGAGGGAGGAGEGGAGGGGGAGAPRVSSIFALYETQAYWSTKDLAVKTGNREDDIKTLLQECCDYVKSGPHRGRYKLKPQFRTTASAAPEVDDGIGAAAAAAAARY